MDIDYKAILDSAAAAAAAGNGAHPKAPYACNGMVTTVDLLKPVDHVDKKNKIVTSGLNVFDLRCSIGYALWAAQNFPDTATAVSHDHLAAAMSRIGELYQYHIVLCAVAHANPVIDVSLRATDVLHSAAWTAVNGHHALELMADAIHAMFLDEPDQLTRAMPASDMAILCLIANDIHRDTLDGHNWYTADGRKASTNTGRILAVAGAKKTTFSAYMVDHGHDMWHFLSDKTLHDIASALSNHVVTVFNGAFVYNGIDVVGKNFSEVFKIGEAAIDRHPAGTMGKGAILVGLQIVRAMIVHISAKVCLTDIGSLLNSIDRLVAWVGDNARNKAEIKKVKAALTASLCAGWGFHKSNPANISQLDNSPALKKFAETNASFVVVGEILYRHLDSIEGDRLAIATTFKAALATLSEGIKSAATGTTVVVDNYVVPDIEIPPSYAQALMDNMRNAGAARNQVNGAAQGNAPVDPAQAAALLAAGGHAYGSPY